MNKESLWQKAMDLGAKSGCHQEPSRSLFIGGWQLPLCARCLGVALGALGALAALPALFLHRPRTGHFLLVAPLAADGLTQRFGKRKSNPLLRYLTGWLAGFGWLFGLVATLAKLLRPAFRIARRLLLPNFSRKKRKP